MIVFLLIQQRMHKDGPGSYDSWLEERHQNIRTNTAQITHKTQHTYATCTDNFNIITYQFLEYREGRVRCSIHKLR